MKKYILPLLCVASFLMFLCAYAFTNDLFWLMLTLCAFVCVIVVLCLLASGNNASKTEKTVSEPLRTSQGEVQHPAVMPSGSADSVAKVVKEAVKEKDAPEPVIPKQEETHAIGAHAVPFPLFKSEFQNGAGLKQCLEDMKAWCLGTMESQLNPNGKESIDMLFEQLKDCVDCQICLDRVKSDYTHPFVQKLGSVEPMGNAQVILQDLIQLAMFMIDLSQMSHSYGNNETSTEDRLWFNALKGGLLMDEARKKARKVDDNQQVTPAQYRNLKTFLRNCACISEEDFPIYNGYVL